MAINSRSMDSDPISDIRTIIGNHYNSNSILKELIQNARDAKASTFYFKAIKGNSNTDHELLKLDALLVFNDGEFSDEDAVEITNIGSTHKLNSKSNVGKYGLGMKSIFHYCDAFFYTCKTETAIVNPWKSKHSKTHQNWDTASEKDDEFLNKLFISCQEAIKTESDKGFMLFIPLRNNSYNHYISKNKVEIETLWQPFDSASFKKSLVNILGVLPCTIESNLTKIIIDTPQIKTCIELKKVSEKYHRIFVNKEEDVYDVYFSTYAEKIYPKLKEIKETGKLPEKTEYNEETDTEEIQSPYKENQSPTLVCILHKNKTIKGISRFQFCCYLPLDDKSQIMEYINSSEYDCDIFIHSEFETDGGRKKLLGLDFSKDSISFPVNQISENLKEDEAQYWWNISLVQELLSVYLPDFLEKIVLNNIQKNDSIVFNYQSFICDIFNKNQELVISRYFLYKIYNKDEAQWSKKNIEEIDEFYIEVNKIIQSKLVSKHTIRETYNCIKEYISNNEKFFFDLDLKRTLGTTHITFNNLFSEEKLLLLIDQIISKRIPIIFSPDYESKLALNNGTTKYLVEFFEPFKNSNSCECSDILNSFELNKEDLLNLCRKLNTFPICQVHNIREKNPAKFNYLSYNDITKIYERNGLYKGYVQNVEYLIHNLLNITESLDVFSISEKNILFKLFQNETQELLDVNKTEHIFKTIMSSASISFTRDETLLSAFLNKIDSRNDNIPDYLSVIKFIVTNDKNRNGCFVYCDCQESDLYTKLFSTSDKEKIFVIKSIYNIFKQKNIDVEKIDSFTVKTYLNSEKEIDFGVFTAEEKERFLLTLTGETFKQVPLHQTIDNSYTSFTDNCYLVVDESIKLPKGYHNENISFIKLSANRELQERQKEILHDSILTETKALEILFNDNTLDLSDKEINSYLVSNINYADTTILNLNDNFRSRKWIELSAGNYCSPNDVINLDTIDKNITIKNIVGNIHTIDDLSTDYQKLKNRRVFLENTDVASKVLLSSYPRKIGIREDFLLENWDIVKTFIHDKFYQLVDCIYDNDKRKRQELLFNHQYVKEGSIEDYAAFITNLSNSKDDYSIILDLVHLCLEKETVQDNLQSFLSIPSLKLPTDNGGWNLAYNISNKFNRSFSKKQQLNQSLVDVIKISEEEKTYVDQENFEKIDATEENIKNFFTKIIESKNEIDPRLLGLFLFLLGGNYRTFAENNGYFTDTDKSVLRENIPFRYDFNPEHWISKCSSVQDAIIKSNNPHRFNVILQIRKGKSIQTKNLCNSIISVDITNSKEGDILSEVNLQTPYNQPPRLILQFLYNDLSDIISRQLKNAIQYVYKVGYYQRQLLDDFYEKLLVSEQASIECTKRGIFKEIFGTLKILKLKEYFSKEFDDYNEANFSENNNDKQIISNLQSKICDKDNPAVKEKILSAVRDYLSDNQYDSTRILYELLQNADDAVGQQIDLLEKTGKDSKSVNREFIIEKKSDMYIISHYGREINFRPSEQFPNSYKYDLSNMIQISNSDKPGQMNTTGKFGLGFKSVYFLCNQPIIRSGRLQFQIIAGLYPEKCGLKKINKGETRIELRNDRNVTDLLSSFEKNIDLVIIFSKFIRTISLYDTKHKWNPDITKINDNLIIEEDGNFTVIRMSNEITLVFQNKDGRIIPLADKYQKLWHTAPLLDEFRYLPYAINCKFEVDTGRKSLAKGHKNDRIILDSADVIADSFVELYKQNTKNIGEMVSLILSSGLKSEDILKPLAEKLCNKLYSSYGVISDGYNGFALITNTSRIFSISETCMENYTNESKYPELFEKIKALLSEQEKNILISDTAKLLCRDNIKKYLIEKENYTRFELIDYLYYSNPEHKISAKLFEQFVELGLFELANNRNEILNENAKLLSLDENWYTIKDIFTNNLELDDLYSQYLPELKCLIKIKYMQNQDSSYSNPNQNDFDFNRDVKQIDVNTLSEKEKIDIEFEGYEPDKTIEELYDWWHSKTDEERKEAASDYYSNLLPDSVNFEDFISSDIELTDAEWFILFILAIYQSKPFCRDLNNKTFLNSLNKLDKEGKLLEKLGDNKPSKNPQLWINVILDFLDGKTYDEIYFTWFNEFPRMIEMSEFKDVYMQVLHDLNKLPEKNKHEILTPEALNEYSGSSLRKAPTIDRAVRIGFSLIIRELLRKNELLAVPKIEKFAFMPKTKCVKFVLGRAANPHTAESADLYKRIVEEIGEEKARFDGYYDIPLIESATLD